MDKYMVYIYMMLTCLVTPYMVSFTRPTGDGEMAPWPGAELFWRQILGAVMGGAVKSLYSKPWKNPSI
jgi:hypothetical protein